MAVNKLRLGDAAIGRLYWGDLRARKAYWGDTLVFDDLFVDEPKIDITHALANRNTLRMLPAGVTTGMTSVSGAAQVVDGKYASTTAGTLVMHRVAFPAANSNNFRVSAVIKVDKTSGRYSRIGFASNTATALTTTPDVYIGHNAGLGIVIGSNNGALSTTITVMTEAQLVDGAEYRVGLTYDNVSDYDTSDTNTGRARVFGNAEPVLAANRPADPWYPPTTDARHDSVAPTAYVPMALTCRTNSALGTIRDLYYIDRLYGATSNGTDPVDNAPFLHTFKQTSSTDRTYIWSKGKSAPLRIIIAAGGTGTYGGVNGFGHGSGFNTTPFNAYRKFWRDLSDKGYTIIHANALHEGWGADDHLAKQLDALGKVQALTGVSDARIYYIGYSLGGISLWRALRGRAGFPSIRAAYCMAGISRLGAYWSNPMFSQIQTRWPGGVGSLDEPQSWSTADLVARGTRVRMITSTADTNVDKTLEHDPMFTKYAGTGLASERVMNVGHFDPAYWDAEDCVNFFEGADA